MPCCHTCPHQSEIDKLRSICAACPGASDNFGGMVHLQAAKDGSGELVLHDGTNVRTAPDYCPGESSPSRIDCPPAARDYLLRLLAEFSSLTDSQAVVVCRMLRGETIAQMAKSLGMTKEAVFSRWKSLCAKSPAWAALSNGSMGLRGGGRKPRDTNVKQGDFFL